jgi:N-ethylmaleimide reductase
VSAHRPSLFDPVQLGTVEARNRILMAPMTRARADRDHAPTALMRDHYTQRASAGLIISEATGISRQGLGWPNAPGIWSEAQVSAWRTINRSVHAAGGKIVCQLWHMGRVVHPSFLNGDPPVSASATTAPGDARTYEGKQRYVEARALEADEIASVIGDFARAALNARAAEFDGVQLHAGSGYLIDQFMRDGTNSRKDDYGGSIRNRLRFLLEIVEAINEVIAAGFLSVRFSPNAATQGCADSDPLALFTAAAAELNGAGLSFLELREPGPQGIFGVTDSQPVSPAVRQVYRGNLVLNEEYDVHAAARCVAEKRAQAVSFGRAFISNPDLPERFARGLPLTPDSRAHWYAGGAQGYTDYAISRG